MSDGLSRGTYGQHAQARTRRQHVWKPGQIFVFGSNLAGIHGAGAALFARKNCGAEIGVGEGLTGWSYAFPTKDANLKTLPLDPDVLISAGNFLSFASLHPELEFFVTRVGCGLAGFTDEQIAPLFEGAPSNCVMPPEWDEFLDTLK